jgi:hypothetical protein
VTLIIRGALCLFRVVLCCVVLCCVAVLQMIEAIQMCFEDRDMFKQEVLAMVLQQLIDLTPVPRLFMRTLMSSVTAWPGLNSFVMGILSRLVAKHVWEDATLWQGFVRCCEMTQPYSYPVLMQLPRVHFETMLKTAPHFKDNLAEYAKRYPSPAFRSLLPALGLAKDDGFDYHKAAFTEHLRRVRSSLSLAYSSCLYARAFTEMLSCALCLVSCLCLCRCIARRTRASARGSSRRGAALRTGARHAGGRCVRPLWTRRSRCDLRTATGAGARAIERYAYEQRADAQRADEHAERWWWRRWRWRYAADGHAAERRPSDGRADERADGRAYRWADGRRRRRWRRNASVAERRRDQSRRSVAYRHWQRANGRADGRANGWAGGQQRDGCNGTAARRSPLAESL